MTYQDGDRPPQGFELLTDQTPAERFNGPYWICQSPAGVRLGFRCKTRHLDSSGACHGGTLSMLADMLRCGLGFDRDVSAAPMVTLSIDFVAPIRDGDWIEAHPETSRSTRSMTFFQALMTVEGKTVARCNGIYRKQGTADTAGPPPG